MASTRSNKKVSEDSETKTYHVSDKDMDALASRVAELVYAKLTARLDAAAERMTAMESRVNDLEARNQLLAAKIDNMEQTSRRCCVRIHGLPEANKDNISRVVYDFFNAGKMKLELQHDAVENCYQLKPRGSGVNAANSVKPVTIVRFRSANYADLVLNKRRLLKGTNITIREDITKKRYELLKLAREKAGKQKAWTTRGNIFLEYNGSKYRITCADEIISILG